ncbi:hypothetical protein EDD86DRAFT_244895 [Gorgonomyces haynaldii]|nr:hypothetical protein EDD86DRAFT_244895 [Gorgonomyces haynaldii]
MLIQLGTLAPSLKSYLILHHTTLAVDLLITIFGNVNRMDFVFIITSWIIQVLLVIFLGVLFLFRFTSSFPFKAGMLQIITQLPFALG